MRLVYVTSSLPQGRREAFVIPELLRLIELGHRITVVPTRPLGPVVHGECRELVRYSVLHRLLSPSVCIAAFTEILTSPRAVVAAVSVVGRSRSFRTLGKNLLVLPKALWLARWARGNGVQHIHAAWMSTPATVAMVASELSGIPWSASAHRWDIEEDNLLAEKVRSATFIRAIARRGVVAISARGGVTGRVLLIRAGIRMPALHEPIVREARVLIAGNLISLKGHRYLIDAIALLRRRGVDVDLDVVGYGPLLRTLRAHAAKAGVADSVHFHGQLPHDRLLGDLGTGRWTILAVPSVVEDDGATEGVPVIMLEAMARGVAVVASDVGGIAEIADDGAAMLVPERDAVALAEAIAILIADANLRADIVRVAYTRVRNECDVVEVVDALLSRFEVSAAPGVADEPNTPTPLAAAR